ncbi:MAG TPA: hypothetical protein DCY59_00705 [Micrococcaceae bacterium]|nr:hypothetical protein [Micrococcaceae bacterium]
MLWNSHRTDASINALREAGNLMNDADTARLSPLGDQHVNMLGRYAFITSTPNGPRSRNLLRDSWHEKLIRLFLDVPFLGFSQHFWRLLTRSSIPGLREYIAGI